MTTEVHSIYREPAIRYPSTAEDLHNDAIGLLIQQAKLTREQAELVNQALELQAQWSSAEQQSVLDDIASGAEMMLQFPTPALERYANEVWRVAKQLPYGSVYRGNSEQGECFRGHEAAAYAAALGARVQWELK